MVGIIHMKLKGLRMKKLIICAAVAMLAGCATKGDLTARDVSPDQVYRAKDSDKSIVISGKIEHINAGIGTEYRNLYIYFDGVLGINGTLGDGYVGDISGTWLNKSVSTSCSGRPVSETWTDVRCIVFIENERTVTLTF
jgi:hypothetical protein